MCKLTAKIFKSVKLQVMKSSFIIILLLINAVQCCGPARGIGGSRRSRKLTPLVFKQHVPNVLENTLGASGLHEGKISREDPRFRDLIPNYNKDIIFKDEEGTGADRLMTQRLKEKLNILAISVMNQWPSVKLRVTEGWDEDDFHSIDSLHYEGRAVDITTSDRDRSKYGMLARLAVEAGFDWVYYESRAHIHCSVKSDSSQASHSSGCFASDSTVQTESGEIRRLSQLKVGEKILSVNSNGETVFSEVIMFLDRDINQTREFVQIKTRSGATIRTTPAHLLPVWKPHKHETKYLYADEVEENDFLLVNVNNNLEPQRVTEVSAVLSRGFIAPLTREGTVVVDSVAASCYALVNSQSLAHISFMPYRTMKTIESWLSRTDNKPIPCKQNGINWYAKALYNIKDYLLPKDAVYSRK
ncbi:CLUMA_CG002401, isoform A [Clunio marinus]|uniref:Hedgehog protein n=1 Tax=Clunio marinus TaxID=568069 RepID=A0A1J1HKS3_9DIPT|nr:CLUMA_CG002401, isoform A [Clunio marinus]